MAHRKLDAVDLMEDEDAFVDETGGSGLAPEDISARKAQVSAHLSRGDVLRAIQTALGAPAFGSDSQTLKDMNLAIVMDALQSAKTSDIPSLAKALSSAELDLLVKFLYRGMAQPETFNSLILLAWHEKAYELGGQGAIVRALSDRKIL